MLKLDFAFESIKSHNYRAARRPGPAIEANLSFIPRPSWTYHV